VPLVAYNLRPEFEYVGSAPRKLGLVLAFIAAGASGIAVFMADSGPEPDTMNAMALAPVEALSSAINATPAGTAKTKAVFVQRPAKDGGSKSPCQLNTAEKLGSECTPGKGHPRRSVRAANERPAIAAVPIGHRDAPAVPPSEGAILVAATGETSDDPAKPADAVPAPAVKEVPAPANSATKPRKTAGSKQARRRGHHQYLSWPAYRYQYRRGGYARLGPWTVWW
jgi:hypothetical protein